jgi:hypothetical protein
VAAYPTFRLGHLVRGDLLLMHARPVRNFGAMADGPADKLKELRDEAMVRIRSLQEKPDRKLIPKAVLQVGDDQKNVLVVDTTRSRMYVYENQGGELKYQTDYYISQGRFGANKTKSGDQRTPIGVYYVNNRIPGPKLPDFYGTGALPCPIPMNGTSATAAAAMASGCTARPRTISAARRCPPTAAWYWPIRTCRACTPPPRSARRWW